MIRYIAPLVVIALTGTGGYAWWTAAQPGELSEPETTVGAPARDRFATLRDQDAERAKKREAIDEERQVLRAQTAQHLASLNAQFASRFSALPQAVLKDARNGRKPGTGESLLGYDAKRLCIFGDQFIEIGREGASSNPGYFVLDGKMIEATMFVRLQSNGAKAPVSRVDGQTLDRLDFETSVNPEETAGTVRIFIWNDQGPKLRLSYSFTAPVECRVFGIQSNEGY